MATNFEDFQKFSKEQLEAAHSRFAEFLREKRRFDPHDRFQSDWYRHHRDMFAAPGERGA